MNRYVANKLLKYNVPYKDIRLDLILYGCLLSARDNIIREIVIIAIIRRGRSTKSHICLYSSD